MIALACGLAVLYFLEIPVYLSIIIRMENAALRVEYGIGALVHPKAHPLRGSKRSKKHMPPHALPMLRRLIRRIRLERLTLRGRLGGDAGTAALICGGLSSLSAALASAMPRAPIYIEATPDFAENKTDLVLACMIRVGIGQIILSAAQGAADDIKERIEGWKTQSIPLRT